jgi:hypothetical protein
MTTYAESRDAVVTLIVSGLQATHPTLPVFWENTKQVDLDAVGNMLLKVAINFDDALQLTVNGDPEHETHGYVSFTLLMKEGAGTREGLVVFQSLTDLVKFKRSAKYTFGVPTPGRKDSRQGWVGWDLLAPFSFNSLN